MILLTGTGLQMPVTPPFSNMRFFQSLWDKKEIWAVSIQELYFFNLIPKNPVCRKTEEQALVKLLTYFKNANLYTELKWRDLSIEFKMILTKLRQLPLG